MPKLQNTHAQVQKFIRMPTLSDAVPATLLFLAARCSLMGISPFATAMFTSVFDLKTGFLGMAVSLFGFLSVGAAEESVRYISAMLLFWLYTRLKTDYKENALLSSAVSGLLLFLSGCVVMAYTGFNVYSVVILLIESLVCSFFYILFEKSTVLLRYSSAAPREQEYISAAVCVGVFISGLGGVVIPPGFELSKIITAYAILSLSMHMSLSIAGSCGVAAGLICSMNSPHAVTLMGLYGISAMFANLLKEFGKYGVAIGFLGGCAAMTIFVGNSVAVSAFEIVAAAVLFIITPNKIHKSAGVFIKKTSKSSITNPEIKVREYLTERLAGASHAFSRLAGIYRSATQKKLNLYNRDICTVIDKTVDRVCFSCPSRDRCMENGGANTYRIMFNILEIIENSGFCNTSNAPREFMALCQRSDSFLSEFAHVYEIFKREAVKTGDFINNRDLLLRQYEEISDILATFHDEITTGFQVLTDAEEKISSELLRCGISVRDIRVFENALEETEVFIGLNKNYDREYIGERISDALGIKMEYRNNINGGLLRFCPACEYDVEFGMSGIAKDNRAISGDSLTSFRVDRDKYCVILCDGMGSGSEAGHESRITVRLLEELLRDGFSPRCAIELVNSSLALGIEKETFSSVDMLFINLMTGTADFYKIGGCRSFIKHGKNVETIFSPSLPVGILPEVHISCISRRLEEGDIVVMLSDGAEGASFGFLSGERMKKIISDDEKTMDDVASAVIESAKLKGVKRVKDDMTVAAIKLKSVI